MSVVARFIEPEAAVTGDDKKRFPADELNAQFENHRIEVSVYVAAYNGVRKRDKTKVQYCITAIDAEKIKQEAR